MKLNMVILQHIGKLALGFWLCCSAARAQHPFALDRARSQPEFWIATMADAEDPVLTAAELKAANQRLLEEASLHRLELLPAQLSRLEVSERIETLAGNLPELLYDGEGAAISKRQMRAWRRSLALEKIPQQVQLRFALVVERASLRRFPTHMRVHKTADEVDLDRFQESALFVGDKAAVIHFSRDRAFAFVIAQRYQAWVAVDKLAFGTREQVLSYGRNGERLWISGADVHSSFVPQVKAVTQPPTRLKLEMGSVLELQAEAPLEVAGQGTLASYVVRMPRRTEQAALEFAPLLIPASSDVRLAPLPLSRANVIRQAFKFLGERYGWGHDYGARDCSGFVSEIYASMGLTLPRNTRDQALMKSFARTEVAPSLDQQLRRALLKELKAGDLIYLPGHVVMVLAWQGDELFVIHDAYKLRLRDNAGEVREVAMNGVAVTPFFPLQFDAAQSYLQAITNIQRILP